MEVLVVSIYRLDLSVLMYGNFFFCLDAWNFLSIFQYFMLSGA